jgi:hypothetical protein
MSTNVLHNFALRGVELLYQKDAILYEMLEREYERQHNNLIHYQSLSAFPQYLFWQVKISLSNAPRRSVRL